MAKKAQILTTEQKDRVKINAKINNLISESDSYYSANKKEMDEYYTNLYKGIRAVDEDMPDWRAKMFIMLTFGSVQQEIGNTMPQFYSVNDFYNIKPFTSTSKDGIDAVLSASVLSRVMKAQEQNMQMYKLFYEALLDCAIAERGWVKTGWNFNKEKKRAYLDYDSETNEITPVETDTTLSGPEFKSICDADMIIDPLATSMDIKKCRYVGYRYKESVEVIKTSKYYNDSSGVAELMDTLKGDEESVAIEELYVADTITKDNKKYSVIRVYARGNGILIKNNISTDKHGQYPFAVCLKNPLQRQLRGISTVAAQADIQEWTNELTNSNVDNMRLAINKMFLLKSSSDIDSNTIRTRPGLVIKVREGAEFSEMPISPVHQDVYTQYKQLSSFSSQILGNQDAGDMMANQTATEAKIDYSRTQGRNRTFADYNREGFLRRLVYQWIELNQQYLKKDDLEYIIPEDDIKKLKGKDGAVYEAKKVDLTVPVLFTVTGDRGMDDKITTIDKLNTFMATMPAVSGMPDFINKQAVAKLITRSLDFDNADLINEQTAAPSNAKPIAPGAGPMTKKPVMNNINSQDIMAAVDAELGAYASKFNVTPDAALQKMSDTLGITPEEVKQQIAQAGGLQPFIVNLQAEGKL